MKRLPLCRNCLISLDFIVEVFTLLDKRKQIQFSSFMYCVLGFGNVFGSADKISLWKRYLYDGLAFLRQRRIR